MEEAEIRERPSEARVREAAELADITEIIVACPKDLAMFQDAVKTTGYDDRIAVRDLADLVYEAVGSQIRVPDPAVNLESPEFTH